MTTAAAAATAAYLPYHEPSLSELLISSTFLLALNGVGAALDTALACGLVGQVLVGVAWGAPGAGWLAEGAQRAVAGLGYVGLVLVVYGGGVETDVGALRRNLVLSVAVALTGVVVPIGLSFALLASPGPFLGGGGGSGSGGGGGVGGGGGGAPALLPAFAAGAALCSTSLGTTFSVLRASGFSRTRLGAVLASAALLDDVVGLVMVRIITSLGQSGESGVKPETILRPVLVSVAFAIAVPIACRFVLKPGQKALDRVIKACDIKEGKTSEGESSLRSRLASWTRSKEAAFLVQTALLIILIVAADFAGASILLAAYLAGAVVSWWSERRDVCEISSPPQGTETNSEEPSTSADRQKGSNTREPESPSEGPTSHITEQEINMPQHTATVVFDSYYAHALNHILKPFFFASIGFSIPISQLFEGQIVWRGIIYTTLMIIGKLVCGLWLVRFPVSRTRTLRSVTSFIKSEYNHILSKIRSRGLRPVTKPTTARRPQSDASTSAQITCVGIGALSTYPCQPSIEPTSTSSRNSELATPAKPLSLYPAAVMGCAMVARGEIGFLISSMAESQGVFRRPDEDASEASALFLIVTWAIFLCTILGPVCTGLLVRRIKGLEKASEASRGARDVLGVWGVA